MMDLPSLVVLVVPVVLVGLVGPYFGPASASTDATPSRFALPPIGFEIDVHTENSAHDATSCVVPEPVDPAAFDPEAWAAHVAAVCRHICHDAFGTDGQEGCLGAILSEVLNRAQRQCVGNAFDCPVFTNISSGALKRPSFNFRPMESATNAAAAEQLGPTLTWESPREGMAILAPPPNDDVVITPGAAELQLHVRLRVFAPRTFFTTRDYHVCVGFDVQSGFDQYCDALHSRYGAVSCVALHTMYIPPLNLEPAFHGQIMSWWTGMQRQRFGFHTFFAWIERRGDRSMQQRTDNDILFWTLSRVRFQVGNTRTFGNVQALHASRHISTVSDLQPRELKQLLRRDRSKDEANETSMSVSTTTASIRDSCRVMASESQSGISGDQINDERVRQRQQNVLRACTAYFSRQSRLPDDNDHTFTMISSGSRSTTDELRRGAGLRRSIIAALVPLAHNIKGAVGDPILALAAVHHAASLAASDVGEIDMIGLTILVDSVHRLSRTIRGRSAAALLKSILLLAARVPMSVVIHCRKADAMAPCGQSALDDSLQRAALLIETSGVSQLRFVAAAVDAVPVDSAPSPPQPPLAMTQPTLDLGPSACSSNPNCFKESDLMVRRVYVGAGGNVAHEQPSAFQNMLERAMALSASASRATTKIRAQDHGLDLSRHAIATVEQVVGGKVPPGPNPHATGTVFAAYLGHDANMCVLDASTGRVLAALELERLFESRYFSPLVANRISQGRQDLRVVRTSLQRAYTSLLEQAGMAAQNSVRHVTAVLQAQMREFDTYHTEVIGIVQDIVNADTWEWAGHHSSHATYAFFDSPFDRALVLSYDGGGDSNQNFEVSLANRAGATHADRFEFLEVRAMNLGVVYQEVASFLSEVTGWPNRTVRESHAGESKLHLSGRMMGYVALGQPRQKYISALRSVYVGIENFEALPALLNDPSTIEEERDLAASAQLVFEEIIEETVLKYVALFPGIEGVVLTGGCALNVLANAQLMRALEGLPVHIPCAPNDGGLSIGMAWTFAPPSSKGVPQALTFIGPTLYDAPLVPALAELAGARVNTTAKDLAELLSRGHVIAVVRGGSEFGPRALGHRSLLAIPHRADVKDRMNRLKFREWWRPVAPMVAAEDVSRIFLPLDLDEDGGSSGSGGSGGAAVWSPYMSVAARFKPHFAKRFPAITHFDGTARLQTVTERQDPWLHRLLMELKRLVGDAVSCNTSFNTRGKPICNRATEAMQMLCSLPELDYVYVEPEKDGAGRGFLFDTSGACKTKALWNE